MPTADRPATAPHAGTTRPRTVALVLAAGAGSRFRSGRDDARHKLSATLTRGDRIEPSIGGSSEGVQAPTILEAALAAALAADVGPVIVVTGADPDVVPARLWPRVIVHHHAGWAEGQMSSLRAGLDVARSLGANAAVVGLGDQPFVEPEAWRAVAAGPGPIAVATYGGRRGNPVRLDADVWDLLPTGGDEGARALMRVRPELVREVPCTGSPADIDTTEDLRRWQNS
jgi:molybdenum cofactor cytidylyltransferase